MQNHTEKLGAYQRSSSKDKTAEPKCLYFQQAQGLNYNSYELLYCNS